MSILCLGNLYMTPTLWSYPVNSQVEDKREAMITMINCESDGGFAH